VDKPVSVDAYFASLRPDARSALEKLRETIRAAAPGGVDAIAWSMPGVKLDGKGVVTYAAFKDHYSFFPMSLAVMERFEDAIAPYATGKGTIRFEYGARLPVGLVKKMVTARVAEVEAKRKRDPRAPKR
jgi:uncharacterized protein YdhG (YjbR/CyaY superfamily)